MNDDATTPDDTPPPEPRAFDFIVPPRRISSGVELIIVPPNKEGMHPTYQRQGASPAAEVADRLTPYIAAVMAHAHPGALLHVTIEHGGFSSSVDLTAGPDAPAAPAASSDPTSARG